MLIVEIKNVKDLSHTSSCIYLTACYKGNSSAGNLHIRSVASEVGLCSALVSSFLTNYPTVCWKDSILVKCAFMHTQDQYRSCYLKTAIFYITVDAKWEHCKNLCGLVKSGGHNPQKIFPALLCPTYILLLTPLSGNFPYGSVKFEHGTHLVSYWLINWSPK